MRFAEAAEQWKAEHLDKISSRTWKNYLPHYLQLLDRYGELDADKITPELIVADLDDAKTKNRSATIVKTRKTIFMQILKQAITDDDLMLNPISSVKLPKELRRSPPRALTSEEIQIISDNVQTVPFGFFPFLLLFTGLHRGEALALTRNNIVDHNILVLRTIDYPDGTTPVVKEFSNPARIRTIPIVSVLYRELIIYMAKLDGDILFPSPKSNRNPGGGYMTQKAFAVAWEKYCCAVNLDLAARDVRNATKLILKQAKVDPYTTARFLGTGSIDELLDNSTSHAEMMVKSMQSYEEETKKYRPSYLF